MNRLRRTLGAARCVRESLRFAVRELWSRPVTGEYHLRGSGLIVVIRHPLLDMWVLEEAFRFRAYDPPGQVAAALVPLGRGGRIIDLGGHIGCFGLFVRQLYPEAEIVSFEPDPANCEVLRRCVQANHLEERWEVVPAAAAVHDGTASFASSFHLSRLAPVGDRSLPGLQESLGRTFPFLRGTPMLSAEHREVACRDVFPYLEGSDLVKIDIEGGEWELLRDARFAGLGAQALVLEYHPMYSPSGDPDAAVDEALASAGYRICQRSRGSDGTVVWAVKAQGATA